LEEFMAYTRDTLIRDVLTAHAESAAVFERHGLACAACMGADLESLSSVATMHEIPLETLLADLNALDRSDNEVDG
jgi:hybrid cluster-associated redox disulfide protein